MIAFTIRGREIYWYGIMYLMSFVLGYIGLYYIGKSRVLVKKHPKIQHALTQDIDTILILTIIGVMVGGRLGYVIIYDPSYFLQNPSEIRAIREGGMSFIGGMIGVAISLLSRAYYKKRSSQDVISIFDSILSIAPLGIILGRIGNFLNQEIYGIVVPEHMRGLPARLTQRAIDWNLLYIYETIDTQLRVNTNFLAAAFEGLLMLLICGTIMIQSIRKNERTSGKITGAFLLGYGCVRFLLEYLRVDSQSEFIGLFSKSQYFFIVFMILGGYFLWMRRPTRQG